MTKEFNCRQIKAVIGLGNPHGKYEKTFHNVGFLFADFALENGFDWKIFKSDAFMNESGLSVRKTMGKLGLSPEEILIVHDDSDLKLGGYKLSFGRGSAGHKGVESIIKTLKTKNFWRLRIGIRKLAKIKAVELVLKNLSADDKKKLTEVFESAAQRLT
ncbi:MAG: aminoacyl-tRNA hydrolase [Patescibacteria group bacterium]